MMSIRKAVIPVAGYGTRFLPVTKAVPKFMLPIIDYPAIHFALEEATNAGLDQIILVMSSGQELAGRRIAGNLLAGATGGLADQGFVGHRLYTFPRGAIDKTRRRWAIERRDASDARR